METYPSNGTLCQIHPILPGITDDSTHRYFVRWNKHMKIKDGKLIDESWNDSIILAQSLDVTMASQLYQLPVSNRRVQWFTVAKFSIIELFCIGSAPAGSEIHDKYQQAVFTMMILAVRDVPSSTESGWFCRFSTKDRMINQALAKIANGLYSELDNEEMSYECINKLISRKDHKPVPPFAG